MKPETDQTNNLPDSPISLVKAIRDGTINGKDLPKEHRGACVEYLANEGCSTSEIAEILNWPAHTIRRDRREIKQRNAVYLDPDFTARHVGQLHQIAQHARENLIRISREKDCPHFVRIKAIKETWVITREQTGIWQSLGYLPSMPTEVKAELRHGLCEPPGFDEITHELSILKASTKEAGSTDEKITQMISRLEELVLRSSASNIIKHVKSEIVEENKND